MYKHYKYNSNRMKKQIVKPEVKVVKLQKMNVIATSGGGEAEAKGVSIFNLSTQNDNKSYGFYD